MHHQGFRRSDHTNEPLSSTLPTLKDAAEDRRFRSIFEQAAVGMAYMDGAGHLQHMNLHFCEILGYEREELLQQGFLAMTDSDDVRGDLAYLSSTRASSGTAPHVRETRYLRKDGSTVWVNLTISPVYLMNDTFDCFVCTIEDISQRKQLEERLLLSEQQATSRFHQLEAIFEAISDGLVVYDADGQIVRTNPAGRNVFTLKSHADKYGEQPAELTHRYAIMDENGQPLSLEQTPVMRVLRGE